MSEGATIRPSRNADKFLRYGRSLSWLAAELTVVVIGVVVGIAISSWWQDTQDQKIIRLSLERLPDNLTTTLVDLQTDVGILGDTWDAARILINSEPSELTNASAASALAKLFDTRTPVPESAEYKALTSTGKLRDISNPELVTAVTAVYEQLPYLQHLADESAKGAWNH